MRPRTRVGILGGGQLARMLLEAAYRLGLEPVVLAESASDPAAQLCPRAIFGTLSDPVALQRFFAQTDLVIFENEFVDCELLAETAAGRTVFAPALETISKIQDKLGQKETLQALRIPASPYVTYPGGAIDAWVDEVRRAFPGGAVFKWAKYGYDGKGTLISPARHSEKFENEAEEFCERGIERGSRIFAESKVSFTRELSLVSSFSAKEEYASYPLVISEQYNGICKQVMGPAVALGVKPELQERAEEYARKLARHLALVGTFAIEFFETPDGQLLVNEIAPRVHNTGHFTQDAAVTNQFVNHWRAVLGLPLGVTCTTPGFAMLNLLGPPGGGDRGIPVPTAGAQLHWYGKAEARPGRKMGHLNGAVGAPERIPELIEELKAVERRWLDGESE